MRLAPSMREVARTFKEVGGVCNELSRTRTTMYGAAPCVLVAPLEIARSAKG